jgi:hypothetical protein
MSISDSIFQKLLERINPQSQTKFLPPDVISGISNDYMGGGPVPIKKPANPLIGGEQRAEGLSPGIIAILMKLFGGGG